MMNQFLDFWRPTGHTLARGRVSPWPRLSRWAAAVVLLLAPAATLAQKTPKPARTAGGSLKGTISAVNGDTLIGVTVKLVKKPSGTPLTVETDENGNYEFHNLGP